MGGRENVDRLAQATFEEKWRQANPWEMDGAEFDLRRYERQFAVLADRHYMQRGSGSNIALCEADGLYDAAAACVAVGLLAKLARDE